MLHLKAEHIILNPKAVHDMYRAECSTTWCCKAPLHALHHQPVEKKGKEFIFARRLDRPQELADVTLMEAPRLASYPISIGALQTIMNPNATLFF